MSKHRPNIGERGFARYPNVDVSSTLAEMAEARKRAGGATRFSVTYDDSGRIAAVTPLDTRTAAPATRPSATKSSTNSDPLELMRRDARMLWKRHGGDVRKLFADPQLRLRRVLEVSRSEMALYMRANGRTSEPLGTCEHLDDGQFDIRIVSDCPLELRMDTLLHELGHARASQVLGVSGRGEAPAITWANEWWKCDAETHSY